VRFDISGTYYTRNDTQNPPPDPAFTGFVSNQFGAVVPGVLPRFKSYGAFSWDSGSWAATLANTFMSSYVDVNPGPDGTNTRRVSSMSLWDLQGQYTGFKNWALTLGVKNLLDTNPPATNQNVSFQAGFDPNNYDARARFVYLNIHFGFK
jgi:iron complex outermembrane receptor protein